MKNLFTVSLLLVFFCSFSQTKMSQEKSAGLPKQYIGVMAKQPDADQLVAETPPALLKRKYGEAKPATPSQIATASENTNSLHTAKDYKGVKAISAPTEPKTFEAVNQK